jgi:hypothetical protein
MCGSTTVTGSMHRCVALHIAAQHNGVAVVIAIALLTGHLQLRPGVLVYATYMSTSCGIFGGVNFIVGRSACLGPLSARHSRRNSLRTSLSSRSASGGRLDALAYNEGAGHAMTTYVALSRGPRSGDATARAPRPLPRGTVCLMLCRGFDRAAPLTM